jgi:hypothetical protein
MCQTQEYSSGVDFSRRHDRSDRRQQLGQEAEAKSVLLDELSKVLGDQRYNGDLQAVADNRTSGSCSAKPKT